MEAAPESQSRVWRKILGRVCPALSPALVLAAGLALRLWMLKQFFQANGDSLIYGGLAKNLLLHGQYALTVAGGEMYPTLIRLPGYPLFLAVCFRLFGMENYVSAAWVQIALELLGCLLLADFAGRIVPAPLRIGARHCTLWLAALCPFTAVYAANPLTEAPTLFVLALALWSAARFRERPGWGPALWFTFAVSCAALLRPDGALAAVALAPALVIGLWRGDGKQEAGETPVRPVRPFALKGRGFSRAIQSEEAEGFSPRGSFFSAIGIPSAAEAAFIFGALMARLKPRSFKAADSPEKSASGAKAPVDSAGFDAGAKAPAYQPGPTARVSLSPARKAPAYPPRSANSRLVRMAVVCVLLALMPFAAWSWRNWQVFHVIEPLAPRYANDPGEDTYPGWQRWMKTWCLDFVSTYEIYWNVPGGSLEMTKLPVRAFDSPAQYAETATLAADYNVSQELTGEIDARFGKLADERIAAHPLRSYLWLPLGRVADMWLRPRVENLPIDLDWWVYAHHDDETRFSWAYAGLNALYLLLGIAGLCLRPRFWRPMLAYMLLRSALLTTVEAPEARYTIECFPMLFALGGIALWWALRWIAALGKRVARLRLRG